MNASRRLYAEVDDGDVTSEYCEWCRCSLDMGHDDECIFRRDVVDVLPY